MLRICKTILARSLLQPRVVAASPPACGVKQTIEEKLGLAPKPKRPLTPYLRFLVKVRPILAQKYPDAKVTEIVKLGADQWAKADAELKQQLDGEYKKELLVYVKKMEEYDKTISEEQKEQIQRAQGEIKMSKQRKTLQKKMTELGKPKRPCTAYMAYLLDNSRKESEPYKEYQLRLAKQWENEDVNVKAKYAQNYTRGMETYRRELQKWEEKMIRLGHIDVVRNEALIEPQSKSTTRKPASASKSK